MGYSRCPGSGGATPRPGVSPKKKKKNSLKKKN
jgi:hypothetical protein